MVAPAKGGSLPYLGSTIFIVTLVAGLAVAMVAWWLVVRALAPRFVERSRERWERRPILTVLLGGVLGGFGTIAGVGVAAIENPGAKLLGLAWLTLLAAIALAGTAGLAARIGRGLGSPSDEGREWFHTLKGGVALELSFLLPFFGWVVLLPIALYGGFGAAVQSAGSLLIGRLRPRPIAPDAGVESP